MGKKKAKKKYDELKLHHDRFVQFIDYLKEHDAEIRIWNKNDITGEKTPLDYGLGESDGLKINNLIAEALNIDITVANDYVSNPSTRENKHPIGDRWSGFGNIITAIEYYFKSDTPLVEKSELNHDDNPYSIRNLVDSEIAEYSKDKSTIISSSKSNFLTKRIKKQYLNRFMEIVDSEKTKELLKGYNPEANYPFADQLEQLCLLKKESSKNLFNYQEFVLKFDDIITEYIRITKNLKSPMFMPSYLDFKLPYGNYNPMLHEEFLESITSKTEENISSNQTEIIINYRYELLLRYIVSSKKVEEWPLYAQVLLLISYYENCSINDTIWTLSVSLLKEAQFVVFGSDDGKKVKAQEDSLSLEALSDKLSKYQFKEGLDKAFVITEHQILKKPLQKYPEPHAVKHRRKPGQITDSIFFKMFYYFKMMYKKGLHIHNNFSEPSIIDAYLEECFFKGIPPK